MKKLYFLSFLLTGSLAFAQISYPIHEPFNYDANSNLGGQGLWVNANSGVEVTIADNGLSYSGLAASSGRSAVVTPGSGIDPQYITGEDITAGTIYLSYLVNINDMPATFTSGGYHIGIGKGTTFGSTVWIKPGTSENTFNIGINKRTTSAATVYHEDDFNLNQTLLVVVSYDFTSHTAKMWVNPAANTLGLANEPTGFLLAETGANVSASNMFFIRQGGANDTPGMIIDEMRYGLSWSSVTPSGPLSVKDNNIDGLKIYPNPVTRGSFQISTDANGVKDVVIFDVLGKQVVKTVTENTVNVSNLTAGVYIVKVTENGKTATKKLVVK